MRFEACAHTYDDHASPQRAFAALVAGFIGASAEEGVLELGAGTGALTRHVVATAAAVHATDASPAMVGVGQRRVPGAKWAVLDAFHEPLPQSGLQVSSGLLQWAEHPVAVLRNWRAALPRGGRMVHAFPCVPCLAEWRSLVPQSPVQWRDESAWRRVFADAGLRIHRTGTWSLRPSFPSALDMVRGLHLSGVTARPHLNAGQLRHALRRYDQQFHDPQGVFATWVWMAVEAGPC